MRHLTVETILEHIENKTDNVSGSHAAKHLAECVKCQSSATTLQELTAFVSEDAANEPSAPALQWSLEIFQPVLRPDRRTENPVRRIAKLVFDSFQQPLAAGVRAGVAGSAPRQLLFRAGDVDVDLRIESGADNRISLSGQVLSEAVPFFENTPVRLESHGVARYRTRTNPVGEFSFDEIPQDTYHLSMDLPEGQVTLFCVYRSESIFA